MPTVHTMKTKLKNKFMQVNSIIVFGGVMGGAEDAGKAYGPTKHPKHCCSKCKMRKEWQTKEARFNFSCFQMVISDSYSFLLGQNGELRLGDGLQYFLVAFGIFKLVHQIWNNF